MIPVCSQQARRECDFAVFARRAERVVPVCSRFTALNFFSVREHDLFCSLIARQRSGFFNNLIPNLAVFCCHQL